MQKRKSQRSKSPVRQKGQRTLSGAREWVGGRISAPIYITEGDGHRAELLLWLELPDDLLLGITVNDPRAPSSMADTLLSAMQRPAAGPPRRPDRVRVADATVAAELRAAVPGLEVRVEDTPELDAVVAAMMESMPPSRVTASYFDGGRLSAAVLAELFQAAAPLFKLAPWTVAHEGQLLRLDIPQLGIEGACVSLIGMLGESLGVLIFRSLAGYHAFRRSADLTRSGPLRHGSLDLGTTILALNFERATDLPASMRHEIRQHGWPIAGPRGYPRIEHRDRDGLPRPLTEDDVRIATACAAALCSFFEQHRDAFREDPLRPATETYTDATGLTVTLTTPCGVGGSLKDAASHSPARSSRVHSGSPLHELDGRLVDELLSYSRSRFGQVFVDGPEVFADAEAAASLAVPWYCYCARVNGRTLADWYLYERDRTLSPHEREWLRAQQRAWLSIWEVLAVEPGKSITVQDLLSAEQRTVMEVSGSCVLTRRDAILARVVDHAGESVFCGSHPQPLPPLLAAQVIERVRAKLRKKTAVATERLRDENVGRYLIARWEEAAAELALQRAMPPRLHNTDGDVLLLTVDHFTFDPAARGQVAACLGAMSHVDPPDAGGREYTFLMAGNKMHKGWDTTITGRAVLESDELRLETNSVRRADELRQRVLKACAGLLRHRTRTHSDPTALLPQSKSDDMDAMAESIASPDTEQLIREFKARHYTDWMDQASPALGGKTPRQATRTKSGRELVNALLKDIENHESRLPATTQFDFSSVRAELRLD